MSLRIVLSLAVLAGAASAQTLVAPTSPTPAAPSWVVVEELSPEARAELAATNRRQQQVERELKKIRARYFGRIRNTEMRQLGMLKLEAYSDPATFPLLLEVFRREKEDVKLAIVNHLAALETDEADATLAWASVFNEDDVMRQAARERLARRVEETGHVSDRIRAIVAGGLGKHVEDEVNAAARVAGVLKMHEMIPHLINAQVSGQSGGGREGNGALAWIMHATQVAFVSDLEPVVADSAVGFDPELSVVSEGTLIRVLDAVVVTYRTEVHTTLMGLAENAYGRPVPRELGWDQGAWRDWYANELVPHMEREKEREIAERDAPAPDVPGAITSNPSDPG